MIQSTIWNINTYTVISLTFIEFFVKIKEMKNELIVDVEVDYR